VRIAAAYFISQGIKAQAVDAWDGGFLSDSNFTSAELVPESWNLIPAKLLAPAEEGILQVVTGFIAKDENGNITTLGRGGSDLSATMIGASCGAEEVQVWKDVDGILSADPRIVKNARPVETVTYEAAAELAYFGAQVLHPRAMQPCMKTGTPVLVKNSYNTEAPGTRIVSSLGGKLSPLQAITSRKNITLVDIVSSRMLGQYGFLAEVFSCFAKYGISVDMVATSEVSVSLTLDAVHDLAALIKDLSRIASVESKTGKAIVTIIGDVRRSSEILARSFRTCELLGVPVQMVSQGASKVNISFIVDDHEATEVVKGLHGDFFEAGPGQIGQSEAQK
jgi:aspartate kinase